MEAEERIDRLKSMIGVLQERGRDTTVATDMLRTFASILQHMEDHLAIIEKYDVNTHGNLG